MKACTKKKQLKKEAKEHGASYNKLLTSNKGEKESLYKELQQAFEKQQFVIYLQPKIVLATEKISDAEALVRWVHPKKGIILPDQFIPALEQNGEIKKLDFYVLEKVCMILERWKNEKRKFHPISVNLSKVYLKDENIADELLGILEKYQVSPKLIQLEITESASQDEGKDIIESLYKLKDKGFSIAMDDFGAGYSSLNLLKDLPIDVLKLDKEFMMQMHQTEKSSTIITYIVKMAHGINMLVVSEGVETEEQAAFLKKIGCDGAQGYLYAKPMGIEDYENLMRR